jgi:hypothetical protein
MNESGVLRRLKEKREEEEFKRRMNNSTLNIVRVHDNRQVGVPDYRILFIVKDPPDHFHLNRTESIKWEINVYPSLLFVRKWEPDLNFPSKTRITMDNRDKDPLYHLLESNGNPCVAMLYKEHLDSWHPFYNLNDLPMLSSHVLIAHLVHYIIWEPDKMRWLTK